MTHRLFKLPLPTILSFVVIGFVGIAHAESVQWNRTIANTTFFACDSQHAMGWGWGYDCASVLANPNVSVTYKIRAIERDTGKNVCNSTVAAGTAIKFEFVKHSYQDIYWFGTGFNMDSPYGDWSSQAAHPPSMGISCSSSALCRVAHPENAAHWCAEKNFLNTWGTDLFAGDNRSYVLLQVEPPIKTLANAQGFDCGTPDESSSVICVARDVGETTPEFRFASTYGKWYFAHWYDTYWQNYAAWLAPNHGCIANDNPLATIHDLSQTQQGSTGGSIPISYWVGSTPNSTLVANASYPYTLQVPSQSISCPITIITPIGAPAAPTVTSTSCTVGNAFTLNFSSTDPDGDQLKYGIDWDDDGSVDQWVPPSEFVPSGTSQSASRTYAIAGQKTVRVIAQNDQGASSEWTTYSFNCGNCPTGYVMQNGVCIFSACPDGYVLQGTQCVVGACTPGAYCQGNDLKDNCTGELIEACAWGCFSGSCNPVPSPNATLKAIPSLVKRNFTTVVSWSSQYATACTVTGTNGDSWTGLNGSQTSSPIHSQTTYTLNCTGEEGADPASIQKKATVNIAPVFEEK